MCGAVMFETTAPVSVFHCHCESCRRSTSQPAVTFVGFTADQVTFSGEDRKVYESSPGVERTFCPNCGSPIAWEGNDTDGTRYVEMYLGLFKERDTLLPTYHAFYEERLPWFDIADGLPRHRGSDPDSAPMAHGPAKHGLPGTL